MQARLRNVQKNMLLDIFPNIVLQTVNDAFQHIDGDRWRRVCEHVEKHVAQCMRDDQHIDDIVINPE